MNNNFKDKLLTLIVIILIAIIIIILLTKCSKDTKKPVVPTGNMDIFNIDIKCKNKKCPVDDNKNKDNPNSKTSDNNGNSVVDNNNNEDGSINNRSEEDIPVFDDETDENIIGEIFIDDNSGNYIYQQNLNIFTNPAYEYTNKIAPGVSNTYDFKTNNISNIDINYYIEMFEETEYEVNLKYRLRRNGEYVVGDDTTWVSGQNIKTSFKRLNKNESDIYSLDWKWFDNDEKDNVAGENMISDYKLIIRFYFEAI